LLREPRRSVLELYSEVYMLSTAACMRFVKCQQFNDI
jgi:hypothetical protein